MLYLCRIGNLGRTETNPQQQIHILAREAMSSIGYVHREILTRQSRGLII